MDSSGEDVQFILDVSMQISGFSRCRRFILFQCLDFWGCFINLLAQSKTQLFKVCNNARRTTVVDLPRL